MRTKKLSKYVLSKQVEEHAKVFLKVQKFLEWFKCQWSSPDVHNCEFLIIRFNKTLFKVESAFGEVLARLEHKLYSPESLNFELVLFVAWEYYTKKNGELGQKRTVLFPNEYNKVKKEGIANV